MNAANPLSRSARRVQDALAARGFSFHVIELPDSTRTARGAAEAIGCTAAQIEQAPSDFVRSRAGFAIGGVPPIGHETPQATWIDEDLMHHDVIWAAAGTPHAVFDLDPATLPDLTGGAVTRLKA